MTSVQQKALNLMNLTTMPLQRLIDVAAIDKSSAYDRWLNLEPDFLPYEAEAIIVAINIWQRMPYAKRAGEPLRRAEKLTHSEQVRKVLAAADQPLTSAAIDNVIGKNNSARVLFRLYQDGVIRRARIKEDSRVFVYWLAQKSSS